MGRAPPTKGRFRLLESFVYWEVADLGAAIERLQAHGARLYRGPMTTSLGATAAMLLDPFGCSLGLLCPADG